MAKIIYDQWGDVVRTLHTADDAQWGDEFTLQVQQDITGIVEQNKIDRELQMDQRFWTGKRENMTKVAQVGVEVMQRAMVEDWSQDDWKKFLNDTSNAHYRVWEGRI